MFDIGWTELLVLAAIAILIVGPKELPRMLRNIGRYAGKMRRMANDFRSQFDDALRESDFDDIRSSVESVRKVNPLKGVRDSVSKGLDPTKGRSGTAKSGTAKSGTATSDGAERAGKGAEAPASDAAMGSSSTPSQADTSGAEAESETRARQSAADTAPPGTAAGDESPAPTSGTGRTRRKKAAKERTGAAGNGA